MSADNWQHTVFSLLAPDAFRRHLAGRVLDRLTTAGGLTVTGWVEVLVTGRQVDAVAQIQHVGAGQAFRYRALDAIFALGPAVALRLEDTAGRPAEQLYRDIKQMKGASAPADARPGTIRHDLGSVNAVLSLLHVSDSPANAARESAAILRADPDGAPAGELFGPADALPGYLLARQVGTPVETRGHREVVAAVRARVAARLWGVLPAAARDEVTGLAATGGLGDPDAGMRIAELAGPVPGDGLIAVLRADYGAGPAALDPDELDLLLRRHRIGLDAWERVVLATSQYFTAAAAPRTASAHPERSISVR